jgi:hypothetical protein
MLCDSKRKTITTIDEKALIDRVLITLFSLFMYVTEKLYHDTSNSAVILALVA